METTQQVRYKCVCPKHGEVNDAYVYRVHMPDFGYDRVSYCLVCAIDYLAMISNEITYEPIEEEKQDELSE